MATRDLPAELSGKMPKSRLRLPGTSGNYASCPRTAASAPALAGMQGSSSLINAIAPRLAGTVGSQTDLPASVAVGSIGNTAIRPFFWLKP